MVSIYAGCPVLKSSHLKFSTRRATFETGCLINFLSGGLKANALLQRDRNGSLWEWPGGLCSELEAEEALESCSGGKEFRGLSGPHGQVPTDRVPPRMCCIKGSGAGNLSEKSAVETGVPPGSHCNASLLWAGLPACRSLVSQTPAGGSLRARRWAGH